jgi:large subunit ribosomal protein L21
MELAVIKTGGKQYVVGAGQTLMLEKLAGDPQAGDAVVFDQVLLVDDGSTAKVGAPTVAGATVKATVISAGKRDKIDVVRYKAKSRYHKRRGHRQPFTKVKIDAIA